MHAKIDIENFILMSDHQAFDAFQYENQQIYICNTLYMWNTEYNLCPFVCRVSFLIVYADLGVRCLKEPDWEILILKQRIRALLSFTDMIDVFK